MPRINETTLLSFERKLADMRFQKRISQYDNNRCYHAEWIKGKRKFTFTQVNPDNTDLCENNFEVWESNHTK